MLWYVNYISLKLFGNHFPNTCQYLFLCYNDINYKHQ